MCADWRFSQNCGEIPRRAATDGAYNLDPFERRPTPEVVSQVMDCGVPHSRREADGGRGLDISSMQLYLAETWELGWATSDGFMGPVSLDDKPELAAPLTYSGKTVS
jgi:hypothetical protein